MDNKKNIYDLQHTIQRNIDHFLKPRNAGLSTLLESKKVQKFSLCYVQLPTIEHLLKEQLQKQQQQIRKKSVQDLSKLQSRRVLTRLVRSQTIDHSSIQQTMNIIQSCDNTIRNNIKQQPKIRVKLSQEYKGILRADKLHTLIEEQIYKSQYDDIEMKNQKAITYIKENDIRLDKDKFIQQCHREKIKLIKLRALSNKEKEEKRFSLNYNENEF